jgi:hypothetical protein
METHRSREQVSEEPLGVAQESAFAFDAPKLLEEGEGDDLRVRESLYCLVASKAAVLSGPTRRMKVAAMVSVKRSMACRLWGPRKILYREG